MGLRFYVFFVLCIVAQQGTLAQNNAYQFSHLDISDGLSHNQVNCIYKDSKGFMWFGTMSGLNRYDGYTFKVFKHDGNDTNSINDDYIGRISDGPENKLWVLTRHGLCIYDPATEQFNNNISAVFKSLKLPDTAISRVKKDSRGNFWFMYGNSGTYKYDPATKQTYHYSHNAGSLPYLISNYVTDINEDTRGNIWFVYNTGDMEMLDVKLNKITYRTNLLSKAVGSKIRFYSFTIDRDNDIWFYASDVDMGVYYFDPTKNTYRHIAKETTGATLKSNIINNIVQADDGLIWIATDHGGINVLNKSDFKITYLLNREDDTKSLRQNSVMLYKDNSGIMWAGTFKEGISYYHKNIIRFPLYRHFASDPNSLNFEDVDKFAEDGEGNLWIGTNGGGLIYFNRKTGKYTQYKHDPNNSNSLSNDIIVSLCIDHAHKLWIGTYFGGLDCFDGKTFTHYRHDDKVASSLPDDRVWSLMEDSSNRLWVGTFAGGVSILDQNKKVFYRPFNQNQLWSSYISSTFEDKDKNIWIGGYSGVAVFMKSSGQIVRFNQNGNDANNVIGNNVNSITQDSRGLIWIAAREGLSIYNLKTNRFTNLVKANGLPDNLILNVLEDNSGVMWLSSSNGLCRIALKPVADGYSFQFKNFDESDGLQAREFNVNAALKTSKGELIFGGGHGFNIFDPLKIQPNVIKPQLIFTDFQLFSQSVKANEDVNGHVILSKAISATNSITLNHSENVFTIEFAALNFFNPGKVKYQYMLQGFDKGWFNASNTNRKATYTNLDAGDYVFKVRASNSDGIWDADYATLNIKVLPPYWKTPLAYLIYFVLIFGMLFLIRRRGILKIHREFLLKQEKAEAERKIEQEREEARRMHELDLMKIKFFTNVSHEFRTPLSLIISPIDNLIKNNANQDQKQQLSLIKRNGKRLLNLVNQLLDFRKMEFNELKLNVTKGDIIQFINEATSSFSDIAQQKNIKFIFESEIDTFTTKFDHDKMERVLFNLLSNAFKFTPAGGHISVVLNIIDTNLSSRDKQLLEIKIIDTGIGIPSEKHEKIFDRFFQDNTPESLLNQGSGIGLSITWEFVKMHGGDIKVESEPGYGSCFIIRLPVGIETAGAVAQPKVQPVVQPVMREAEDVLESNKKPVVLLVEDNDDLRFYLKDNLKQHFHIIEAVNGKDGWQRALALHPNLIVSDVSMPEMNGMELCKKLKGDSRTAHIPIILLTALIDEQDQLAGLEKGANDYITKPFNFEILLSKIQNLLLLQKTIKKTYQKQTDIQAQHIEIISEDEKFLKNVLTCIENNVTNPNFSVEELSRQVSMSRVSLYKRLLTLTGKTPIDCIRTIRLKRAVQLLEKSKLSIAMVAYEVGFNNPTYFAKIFREEYGMLPSEYIVEMRKKEKEGPPAVV